jgi:phosphatidate cytidylyltransferase
MLLMMAVGLWAIIILWIQGYPSSSILWSSKPVLVMLGAALLAFTWLSIVSVLLRPSGQWLLLVGILIVVMMDVGGFFVGKFFGRHKLAPVVSPGKTWEGFAGGILFQLIIVGVLMLVLPNKLSALQIFLILPVALFAVIGDLFESMVKRQSGLKDSGSILPGHGGILDRIDGIMAAMPIYALLVHSLEFY